MFTPIHPGEQLEHELSELGMSSETLAQQIQTPCERIAAVLDGRRGICGDLALRLGHFFDTSPEFWMNLQKQYELRVARQEAGRLIEALPTLKSIESQRRQ